MATFTEYTDILPSPTYGYSFAGEDNSNTPGPGYASVKVSSEYPTIRSRTNSGRLISRAQAGHKFTVDISYNPMTRAEFEPINSFLQARKGQFLPFYVDLPQYTTPQDSTWNSSNYVNLMSPVANIAAGTSVFTITNGLYTLAQGYPRPGDMFTFSDPTNTAHEKAYMVTRTETNTTYNSNVGQPAVDDLRIQVSPFVQRAVDTSADLIFKNSLIKVVLASDVMEYSLETNNLFSFSLKLEEVQ